jgi:hypothetical protein
VTAAGGKLVAMYGNIADGPGAMAIADVDPSAAPPIAAVVARSMSERRNIGPNLCGFGDGLRLGRRLSGMERPSPT